MASYHGFAGEALRRDALPHQGDRRVASPTAIGDWFYYTRTVEGSQYPIHCRKPPQRRQPSTPRSPKQIILDVNKLAEGQPFMSVGALTVSPDGYTARLLHRQHRLPPVHAAHPRPRRPEPTLPTPPSASARSPGPPTRTRSSTPPKTRSPSARTNSSATAWAIRHDRRHRRLRRTGRALQPRRRQDPRRQFS